MTKKQNIIVFCETAINQLRQSSNFGEDYCNLKMKFFRQFQNPFIFSTRFGANFFEEILALLRSNSYVVPSAGEKLGEYDLNVNKWINQL